MRRRDKEKTMQSKMNCSVCKKPMEAEVKWFETTFSGSFVPFFIASIKNAKEIKNMLNT